MYVDILFENFVKIRKSFFNIGAKNIEIDQKPATATAKCARLEIHRTTAEQVDSNCRYFEVGAVQRMESKVGRPWKNHNKTKRKRVRTLSAQAEPLKNCLVQIPENNATNENFNRDWAVTGP